MIKDTKIISSINKYILEKYPEEAVIGYKDNELIFYTNIHNDPVNHFKIDPREYYNNIPSILIHSHTSKIGDTHIAPDGSLYDPRTPSYIDMVTQCNLDIPFGIASTSGEDVSEIVYFPDYDAKTLGQPYMSGVHDCLSIIQRYYWQEHNIKINDFPREVGFWYEGGDYEPQHSRNLYEENYKQQGFYEVDLEDIQPSDVLLIRLIGRVATHAGVYIGNDKFIHHLTKRLSNTECLVKWRKRVTKVLRCEKLYEKN